MIVPGGTARKLENPDRIEQKGQKADRREGRQKQHQHQRVLVLVEIDQSDHRRDDDEGKNQQKARRAMSLAAVNRRADRRFLQHQLHPQTARRRSPASLTCAVAATASRIR
ncbi:MAG TPA: hypothetical protein PLE50_13865 [Rhabdaerophilum sp.]|nr:hypothetical protein [Rhabdaerophilum sp.]